MLNCPDPVQGLCSPCPIFCAGQFLTTYNGVVISLAHSEARRERYARRGITGQYDFELKAQHVPRGALTCAGERGVMFCLYVLLT